MPAFSSRYDAALKLAASAHRNQLRKSTDIPYIAHPMHVSVLLLRHGFGEDLVIAGLLHDVVEDCDIPIARLAAEFGETVAQLVEAVSEARPASGVRLSWEQIKADKLAHLRAGGPDVAALKAADALHNARSIIADYEQVGPLVWQRFQRGSAAMLGYYQEILASVRSWLGDHPLADELAAAVDELATLARVKSPDRAP